MNPLTRPITVQPGRSSWKLRHVALLGASGYRKVSLGTQRPRDPQPTTSNHRGGAMKLSQKGHNGVPTSLGNVGHFPQPRHNLPTEILGVPVVQVTENRACASAPPTGIRKTSTYQPANP